MLFTISQKVLIAVQFVNVTLSVKIYQCGALINLHALLMILKMNVV